MVSGSRSGPTACAPAAAATIVVTATASALSAPITRLLVVIDPLLHHIAGMPHPR